MGRVGGSRSELAVTACAIRAPGDAGGCLRNVSVSRASLSCFAYFCESLNVFLYSSVKPVAVEFILGFFR